MTKNEILKVILTKTAKTIIAGNAGFTVLEVDRLAAEALAAEEPIKVVAESMPEPCARILAFGNAREDEGDKDTREWFKAYLDRNGVFVNAETGQILVEVTHWRVMPADPTE